MSEIERAPGQPPPEPPKWPTKAWDILSQKSDQISLWVVTVGAILPVVLLVFGHFFKNEAELLFDIAIGVVTLYVSVGVALLFALAGDIRRLANEGSASRSSLIQELNKFRDDVKTIAPVIDVAKTALGLGQVGSATTIAIRRGVIVEQRLSEFCDNPICYKVGGDLIEASFMHVESMQDGELRLLVPYNQTYKVYDSVIEATKVRAKQKKIVIASFHTTGFKWFADANGSDYIRKNVEALREAEGLSIRRVLVAQHDDTKDQYDAVIEQFVRAIIEKDGNAKWLGERLKIGYMTYADYISDERAGSGTRRRRDHHGDDFLVVFEGPSVDPFDQINDRESEELKRCFKAGLIWDEEDLESPFLVLTSTHTSGNGRLAIRPFTSAEGTKPKIDWDTWSKRL